MDIIEGGRGKVILEHLINYKENKGRRKKT
jgi:hypothetical protein